MEQYKIVMLGIIVTLSFCLIASEIFSLIRKRNANTKLTQAVSDMITDKIDYQLSPPNPVQIAFVVDALYNHIKNNKTPAEFLEYMGLTDDLFSQETLTKPLQDLFGPNAE